VTIRPEPFAFTCIVPGLGFLPDVFSTPFIVKWKIENNFATSDQLPGVRIPGAPFMGVSGLAPSKDKLKEWTKRENQAMATGKLVFPRSEEHTSELQSRSDLVCRLLLEKK